MTYVKCPYCEFQGQEPTMAEFETLEKYEAAVEAFEALHVNCPETVKF